MLTFPLRRKFHTDSKTGLKINSINTINTLGFKFRGKRLYIFLKLYGESWPKFEQVSEKVPTPRTLEPLAFYEYSLYTHKESKSFKGGLFIES